MGLPQREYLLFVGRVLGNGRMYGEGGRLDGWRQLNFPISSRGRVTVFYHDSPPHFQVLPAARSEQGEVPGAGLLGNQS